MRRRRSILAVSGLLVTSLLDTGQHAYAAGSGADGTIAVHGGSYHQVMDGFGVSTAFQRASLIHGARGLSAQHQKELLDLLFSRDTGAGLSMLRLGIGSSADSVYDHMHSIEPTDPGGPD